MAAELSQTKVLLVEGKDEENFFKALFKHINKNDVEIVISGGKERLKVELPALLKRSGFSAVTSYAIVVDADIDSCNTFQSVIDLLKRHHQPAPQSPNSYAKNGNRQIGVYIMPGNLDNGMLEDLCLKTVTGHPAIPCLNHYFVCLQETLLAKPLYDSIDPQKNWFSKNLSKARALAFLAALHEPFASVGVAALNGYWGFDHESIKELKGFLHAL